MDGWTSVSPISLRSAPIEDLGCSPSEVVYRREIHLLGEFFETPTSSAEQDVSGLLVHLRSTMAALRPKETTLHRRHTVHIPVDLECCSFFFFRHDAHRTPLQCIYDGPFRVLLRAAKYITLDINGRQDTVSVDSLKPAFVDTELGLPEEVQHRYLHILGRSRKGRVIRLPAKLLDIEGWATRGSSVAAWHLPTTVWTYELYLSWCFMFEDSLPQKYVVVASCLIKHKKLFA